MSIRQNFAAAVTVPEWVKGKSQPKDSPAVYAIAAVAGKIITIEASFATDPSGPESVGTTQADVKELAEAIDKEMLSHLGGLIGKLLGNNRDPRRNNQRDSQAQNNDRLFTIDNFHLKRLNFAASPVRRPFQQAVCLAVSRQFLLILTLPVRKTCLPSR